MARPLRVEFPQAVYHVTARGNDAWAVGGSGSGPIIEHFHSAHGVLGDAGAIATEVRLAQAGQPLAHLAAADVMSGAA